MSSQRTLEQKRAKAAWDNYKKKTGKTTLCKGDMKAIIEEVRRKKGEVDQEADNFLQELG